MTSLKLQEKFNTIKNVTERTSDKSFFGLSPSVRNFALNGKVTHKRSASSWRDLYKLQEITSLPILVLADESKVHSAIVANLVGLDNVDLNDEVIRKVFKSSDEIMSLYEEKQKNYASYNLIWKILYYTVMCYEQGYEIDDHKLDSFLQHTDRHNSIAGIMFECIQRNYDMNAIETINHIKNYAQYGGSYDTRRKEMLALLKLDSGKTIKSEALDSTYRYFSRNSLFEEPRLGFIQELLQHISFEQLIELLSEYDKNDFSISNFEFERMVMKARNGYLISNQSIFVTLFGEKNGKLLEELSGESYVKGFVVKMIQKKKNAFLRKLSECVLDSSHRSEVISALNYLLNYDRMKILLKILDFNSLTIENLKTFGKHSFVNSALLNRMEEAFEDIEGLFTFNEFKTLYDFNTNFHFNFYKECLKQGISLDRRLNMLRQLPSFAYSEHGNTMKLVDHPNCTFEKKEGFIEELVEKMQTTKLNDLITSMGIKHKNELGLFTLIYFDEVKHFLSDIESMKDLALVCKYGINGNVSLKELKKTLYLEDEDYTTFLMNCGCGSEFLENYAESIIRFHEKGMTKVFNKLYSKSPDRQRTNLQLITKAELANKLADIKYVDEDFYEEIGMEISPEQKDIWKKDFELKGDSIKVRETSDYDKTILIGQYPVTTCQHWSDGSYNNALLSNFDTNKKVVTAYYKGKYVARAIVRLTKMTETTPIVAPKKKKPSSTFGFVDIEEKETVEVEAPAIETNEKLAIFLERIYTSLDSERSAEVNRLFIEMLADKAKQMGAELVLANCYQHDAPVEIEEKEIYVYISKSKNGNQYLDSLGGSANDRNSGTYNWTKLNVAKL